MINRDAKPLETCPDAEAIARIRRIQDRFDEFSGRIAEAFLEIPEAEGMAEIDAVAARERLG